MLVQNSTFISAPGPGWAAPTHNIAPAVAPAEPAPLDPARAFEGWDGMSARARARAIRNAGVLAARAAGLSRPEIADATGLVRSRVTAILQSYHPPPS